MKAVSTDCVEEIFKRNKTLAFITTWSDYGNLPVFPKVTRYPAHTCLKNIPISIFFKAKTNQKTFCDFHFFLLFLLIFLLKNYSFLSLPSSRVNILNFMYNTLMSKFIHPSSRNKNFTTGQAYIQIIL